MEPLHIPAARNRQQGASLMVMLVILIIGLTTFLVGALSQNGLMNLRISATTDVLAQAKDALIGRAAKDAKPGSLPCPDINNDGISEGVAGNCTNYIGRLPWKSLGLPDLRDSNGERLWYAISSNFKNSATINSESLGTITVFSSDGTQLNNGVGSNGAVALIIAPGAVLNRQDGIAQSRGCTPGTDCDAANTDICTAAPPTVTPKCNPKNFLDVATIAGNVQDNANSAFAGTSTATSGFIQGVTKDNTGSVIVNDQILVITQEQLMPVVEMRIAREARSCLEAYATTSVGHYPWPATISSGNYLGEQGTLFGRFADTPNADTTTSTTTTAPITSSAQYNTINDALTNLQNAVAACRTNDGSTNTNNLKDAADVVSGLPPLLPNPPYTSAFKGTISNLGSNSGANNACQNIENSSSFYNNMLSDITAAVNALNSLTGPTTTTDVIATAPGMQTGWPASCIVSTTYWPAWKSQVFYQIANSYKPGGTGGVADVTINSTGAYRAAVVVSRRPIAGQVRNDVKVKEKYLEAGNQHAATAPSLNFESYKPIDPANFSNVNDLALCLDGFSTPACQ